MTDIVFPKQRTYGTVVVNDWMRVPDGRNVPALCGKISLIVVQDVLGFEPTGRDANWAILIEGDHEQVVILGCQVRSVFFHSVDSRISPEYYCV